MSELLSIQEVADLTGLHEITIRRYIRSGELEAVRIGRRIRVRRTALDYLLKPMQPVATPESAAEDIANLKESAAIYQVAEPGIPPGRIPAVIGKVATGLVQLPVEDIAMVAQLVARLQRQRLPAAPRRPPAAIVAEARRQAALLRDIPRAEIAARFEALTEEIRGQAVAQGTAIDGDWFGD
jgi:excisionase family DNA binding protein